MKPSTVSSWGYADPFHQGQLGDQGSAERGPSRSLPTSGFPDSLSNDSSRNSSAINMPRR